jgi:DNA-binding NarL/FixJ family response regulator
MADRRMFVIWTHPLFHESVRLLLDHPGLEWVGETSNYEAAQDALQQLRPDTILIEEAGTTTPNKIMEILEACPWDVRVLGLNLEDNHLKVYHREQRTVGQVEDLLNLIQDDLA